VNASNAKGEAWQRIAFLGLGVMGFPMAGHLAAKGHAVTVYNRSGAKAEAWVANTAAAGRPPREAAAGQDFVMACVGNDDDLRAVCTGADGAFAGMAAGAVFVDHTTVSAQVTREMAAAPRRLGWALSMRRCRAGRRGRKRRAVDHVRRMKAAVVTFPGSNCDRDLAFPGGREVARVWHKDTDLPAGVDVVGIPGGFSFGDYLRCGAIAARAPIVMAAVAAHAARGGYVLGICNGFQVLTEMGCCPGPDAQCRAEVHLPDGGAARGHDRQRLYRRLCARVQVCPVAHHDGNYTADAETLARLRRGPDRLYLCREPERGGGDIAGMLSENRRVLGMMPHPERAADPRMAGTDGSAMFRALDGA
jgi:phosphoribosylformylglycinamidine synthase subunit PurQ / glutaminase